MRGDPAETPRRENGSSVGDYGTVEDVVSNFYASINSNAEPLFPSDPPQPSSLARDNPFDEVYSTGTNYFRDSFYDESPQLTQVAPPLRQPSELSEPSYTEPNFNLSEQTPDPTKSSRPSSNPSSSPASSDRTPLADALHKKMNRLLQLAELQSRNLERLIIFQFNAQNEQARIFRLAQPVRHHTPSLPSEVIVDSSTGLSYGTTPHHQTGTQPNHDISVQSSTTTHSHHSLHPTRT